MLTEVRFQSKQARLFSVYQEVRKQHSDHSHLIQLDMIQAAKNKLFEIRYTGAQILLWYKVHKNIETIILPSSGRKQTKKDRNNRSRGRKSKKHKLTCPTLRSVHAEGKVFPEVPPLQLKENEHFSRATTTYYSANTNLTPKSTKL